jgi:hypothetical protein
MSEPYVVETFHRMVRERDFSQLEDLVAEDAVFHSPIVHSPQVGKKLTMLYLQAAYGVFGKPSEGDAGSGGGASKFHYVREVVGERDAVLEFVTEMDGIVVNGVDMIRWNDDDKIVDFKVMVRPLKAINHVHAMMAGMLEKMKGAGA